MTRDESDGTGAISAVKDEAMPVAIPAVMLVVNRAAKYGVKPVLNHLVNSANSRLMKCAATCRAMFPVSSVNDPNRRAMLGDAKDAGGGDDADEEAATSAPDTNSRTLSASSPSEWNHRVRILHPHRTMITMTRHLHQVRKPDLLGAEAINSGRAVANGVGEDVGVAAPPAATVRVVVHRQVLLRHERAGSPFTLAAARHVQVVWLCPAQPAQAGVS